MDIIQDKIGKIREEGEGIKKEVTKQALSYVVASLGLVAGLAWNEAIKAAIEYLFPLSTNTLAAKFIYAVLITIVVVVMTSYLVRLLSKENKV